MSNFEPLTELPESRVYLPLPEYVPAERVGVNLSRLDMLASLGGFATGVTIGAYSGDTTEYQHEIVGHDDRGTAYAGASSVKRAESSQADYDDSHWPFSQVHSSPPLGIRVNMPEITQRVTEANALLRDPNAWATQLNRAVLEGLRQATWDHYVRHPQYGELFVTGLAGVAEGAYHSVEGAARNFIISNFTRAVIAKLIYRQPVRGICWSLIPGAHVDRALMVSGMSRALKVIKAIDALPQTEADYS